MNTTDALQREIGQTRPFRSAHQEALVSLLRSADVVRSRLESWFEPHGLTFQQYNVLRILRGAKTTPLPTMEIASRMIERAPGITRLMDRLVQKGLVERVRCEEDRRRVLCSISAQGMKLLSSLDGAVDELDDQVLGQLREEQATVLIGILEVVREADR